jgi:hypothetical protein
MAKFLIIIITNILLYYPLYGQKRSKPSPLYIHQKNYIRKNKVTELKLTTYYYRTFSRKSIIEPGFRFRIEKYDDFGRKNEETEFTPQGTIKFTKKFFYADTVCELLDKIEVYNAKGILINTTEAEIVNGRKNYFSLPNSKVYYSRKYKILYADNGLIKEAIYHRRLKNKKLVPECTTKFSYSFIK